MSELEKALSEAKEQLRLWREEEGRTGEAMDSMERRYWEGYVEALSSVIGSQMKVGA